MSLVEAALQLVTSWLAVYGLIMLSIQAFEWMKRRERRRIRLVAARRRLERREAC